MIFIPPAAPFALEGALPLGVMGDVLSPFALPVRALLFFWRGREELMLSPLCESAFPFTWLEDGVLPFAAEAFPFPFPLPFAVLAEGTGSDADVPEGFPSAAALSTMPICWSIFARSAIASLIGIGRGMISELGSVVVFNGRAEIHANLRES